MVLEKASGQSSEQVKLVSAYTHHLTVTGRKVAKQHLDNKYLMS